jgi:hypothetical protein
VVAQGAGGAGFLFEAAAPVGVSGEFSGENLEGDVAAEADVAGAIDFAHGAGS